jgi:predicted amidohydrolase YtcJ
VGKAADVIVLDRHLSAQSTADEVRSTRVTRAYVGGRQVTP